MDCLHCQRLLAKEQVSYTVNRQGYHLILDDVPAWVCQQCGEPLFSENTVTIIQAMLTRIDHRLPMLSMEVSIQ